MSYKVFLIKLSPNIESLRELEEVVDALAEKGLRPDTIRSDSGLLLARYQSECRSQNIEECLSLAFSRRTASVFEVRPEFTSHAGLSPEYQDAIFPGLLAPPVPKPQKDALEGFIGIDPIIEQFRASSKTVAVSRFSNKHLGTSLPIGFLNTLLVGPPGAGKTTLAKMIANFLRETGVIDEAAKIEFMAAAALVGRFIGHTEDNLRDKMSKTQGGVLILDEIDALLDSSSFGIAALSTLNTEMGNSPNNPIIIGTCYGTRYDALMSANQGLAGRFAQTLHLQAYPNKTLIEIFKSKVTAAGLTCNNTKIFDALDPLLLRVRNLKKGEFANAREVDNIFDAVIRLKSARQHDDIVRLMQSGQPVSQQQRENLLPLQIEDIPDFDGELRAYVKGAPSRTPATEQRLAPASTVVPLRLDVGTHL